MLLRWPSVGPPGVGPSHRATVLPAVWLLGPPLSATSEDQTTHHHLITIIGQPPPYEVSGGVHARVHHRIYDSHYYTG